ncbi:MAG: nucleotide exchange factor GrpE [Calditrichaeota bacterium]|nr:nucleotide exchange factor GrpE [Calditrichota bacterium]
MSDENKNGKEISIEFLEDENANAENAKTAEKKIDLEEKSENSSEHQDKKTSREGRKLEELKKKYEDVNEQFLRLRAEFANYKKRVDRDQIDFAEYIKGEVIKKFLPVIDDFEHMIKNSKGESANIPVLEGAQIIYNKFIAVLKELGVSKMDVLNQEFDPQLHEAMMMQPTENEDQNGKVIEVFQEGYVINNRLLRPAKVVVGQYTRPEDRN